MKYFLTLWVVMLVTTGVVVAEESPFKKKNIIKPLVYTECHAGKRFIIAVSNNGVAIMQIFKDTGDMVPKPCECPKEDEQ